jgi:4-hydroxymandelate oxidase
MTTIAQLPPGVVSLDDYEALARPRLDPAAWAYISGGVADERTVAWNREAFDRIRLCGRVLADMSQAHTRVTLLGHELEFPILLAPVAAQRLAHPRGECETAQAASAARAAMVVSTEASFAVADIAHGAQVPMWFQLYIQHDREFTRDLVQRVEQCGYSALVLTADAPVSGARNRQQRAGFCLPDGMDPVNLRGCRFPDAAPASLVESPVFNGMLKTAATWRDLDWLRSITRLPIVLKGVTSDDDAARAIEWGIGAIAVSNHGGRTLDTLPAAIDLLRPIAARVAGRVPLLMDGGVRRGTDVLKAIALGASAVMIGRPYVYALAVAGALGVAHVIAILRAELEMAMALTGCATIADIKPDIIWKG